MKPSSALVAPGPALAALLILSALPAAAQAQADVGWQACAGTGDPAARLACFDRWAQAQPAPAATQAPAAAAARVAAPPAPTAAQAAATAGVAIGRFLTTTTGSGCHDRRQSALSRYWELEGSTDCGNFGIRGYRPISMATIAADGVNVRPTSGNPDNNVTTDLPYGSAETRLQLSVRTKLLQGLLTQANPAVSDSLWFGYTQQSYWQLFSGDLSRPFRTTDHEPELIYVYPSDYNLPAGWRMRYSGVGLVHQSNGQALPYSRSWNRLYLMAGFEQGDRFQVQARIWKRLPEGADDNPGISDFIGRAEVSGSWNINRDNLVAATVRSSLSHANRGSVRLEWLRALHVDANGVPAGVRLHTQLFSGYGDSLLDYNYRRRVLSVGLSLIDW